MARHETTLRTGGALALILLAPVIAGIGLATLTTCSDFTMGVWPDGMAYIESARWFAAGQGVSLGEYYSLRPLLHWPPGYPVVLAAGTMLGATAERAAEILHPICLVLTLLLLGILVLRSSRSLIAAVVVQWIAALSWPLFYVHVYVLSDALFLPVALGAVWLVLEWHKRGSIVCLGGAAILMALSVLIRFAGLGIILGLGVYVVWQSRRRIRDALILAIPPITAVVAWSVVQSPHGHFAVGGRSAGISLPMLDLLKSGLCALGTFFLPTPEAVQQMLLAVPAIVLLAVGVRCRRTRLFGVVGTGYLVFILLSLSTAEPEMAVDQRTLLPVLPMLLGIVGVGIALAVRCFTRARRVRPIALCALVILVGGYAGWNAVDLRTNLVYLISQDAGLEGRQYRNSAVLARLQTFPPDALVVCGNPILLHFLTGRVSLAAPRALDTEDLQLQLLIDVVECEPGLYVDARMLTAHGTLRAHSMSWYFDLKLLYRESDGDIYSIAHKKST